jgi:hypothetical protein
MTVTSPPFALSLSKGVSQARPLVDTCFDKLSTNGDKVSALQ